MHPPRAAPAFGPAGPEFRANTFSTGGSLTPKVAVDAAGDFVVAWQSANRAGAGSDLDIFAQRFSAAGVPQGGEFQVNTYTTDRQNVPAVALSATGDFVVAWNSFSQDGSLYGVYAQRYNAAGVP